MFDGITILSNLVQNYHGTAEPLNRVQKALGTTMFRARAIKYGVFSYQNR